MKIISLDALPTEGVSHNPEIKKQVFLRRGEIPHLTNFSRSRLQPRQVAQSHAHADMYEIFYIESGSAIMRIDGKEHHLKAGACIAIEPRESHEIVNAGSDELVLSYFGIEV